MLKRGVLANLLVMASCCAASAFAAQTIYVDAGAPAGGDGQTWATAYNDLQDALATAATLNTEPIEVWVAAGVYKPAEPNGDRHLSFVMQNNVALYGGFPIGGGDWASRDPELHETILSGDLNGDDQPGFVNYDENSFHVMRADKCDETSIIDGFAIAHGSASEEYGLPGNEYAGGGFELQGAECCIRLCVFRENYGRRFAGAIYVTGDYRSDGTIGPVSPIVSQCQFIGNQSEASGGAVCSLWSNAVFDDCEFIANEVYYIGGAVSVYGGAPTFSHCLFRENRKEEGDLHAYGGGAISLEAYFYVEDPGRASLSYAPRIVECVFENNFSRNDGGAIWASLGDGAVVENSVFVGNQAVNKGGAVAVDLGSGICMRNCLIVANSAEYGGGAASGYSYLTNNGVAAKMAIDSCVFVGNVAESCGAGYGFDRPAESHVVNCIVAGNYPSAEQAIGRYLPGSGSTRSITAEETESAFDVHHCCIEGGADSENIIDADPMFVDPGHWDDNGTPEDTSDDTWVMGDYRLQSGSPCIDSGDNTAIPNGLVTDLAGNYRRWDDSATTDTGVGTAPIVDMGVHEFGGQLPGDMNCDDTVDSIDIEAFVIALVSPGNYASQYPNCDAVLADCNGDATVDVFDIDAFVAALVGN